MRKHLGWWFVVSLCGTVSLSAQTNTITGHERLGWDQDAPNLATASAYKVDVDVDSVVQPTASLTCAGTTPPFLCQTAFPAMTLGSHVLRARVVDVDGTLSEWSAPFTVTVRVAAATPLGLRILR